VQKEIVEETKVAAEETVDVNETEPIPSLPTQGDTKIATDWDSRRF